MTKAPAIGVHADEDAEHEHQQRPVARPARDASALGDRQQRHRPSSRPAKRWLKTETPTTPMSKPLLRAGRIAPALRET
jgi:hypothetical protein